MHLILFGVLWRVNFLIGELCFLFQDEALNIPGPVDQLLSDYAKRFHEIKTPRKLLWKKSLGTVKVSCFYLK